MGKKPFAFLRPWHLLALLGIVILLVAIPLVAAQIFPMGSTTPGTPTPVPGGPTLVPVPAAAVLNVEQSILNNIQTNGDARNTKFNGGLGGLWVNWRGASPSPSFQTNLDDNGHPDSTRHDPLTDIRYLHALWLYKSQHPTDTRYQSELDKYTKIIQKEYTQSNNERGWLFDEEFLDLYRLSQDPFYKETAISLATSYAQNFNAKVGIIFKRNAQHPQGSYRVDLVLEAGCALIQAGTLFQHPDWVQKGQSIINFIYAHAYIPRYHMFPEQIDQVLLPDGSVNPTEVFYSDSQRQSYTVSGNIMEMGALSQMIFSLVSVYQVTHQQDFLNKATDLLDQVSLPQNPLNLWDKEHEGYYMGIVFTGTGPGDPGQIQMKSLTKEAGRQMTMLPVFHLMNSFTNNKYQLMEEQMRDVALYKAYYAPAQGVLYEVNADWTPKLVHGQPQNWVTSEAMGVELEALFTIV